MRDVKRSIFTRTGYRLFLTLICSIFVGEMLIMLLIDRLPRLSRWGAALLDSALLLIWIFPFLYFLVFRPLMIHISERKRAEEKKEELEVLNRQLQKTESLGRMAGAIAHHFNNQLAVVMGNLQMAIGDLPQGAGPVNDLNAAMRAAHKAAEMSGLMLTYLGQTHGRSEPLDLSEACLRSLPTLRAAMPKKVVLETHLPSPGPVIIGNANQIQEVLTNLLTNAGEAIGEDGGSIHLSVKTVSPSAISRAHRYPIDWHPQDTAYACMEVKDVGCGIGEKDIERLFDPFFSTKFIGRGLGLSVVMGIARAHGGGVTVESKPGRGSAFRVFFPVSADEVARHPEKTGNEGDTLMSKVSPAEMEGWGDGAAGRRRGDGAQHGRVYAQAPRFFGD